MKDRWGGEEKAVDVEAVQRDREEYLIQSSGDNPGSEEGRSFFCLKHCVSHRGVITWTGPGEVEGMLESAAREFEEEEEEESVTLGCVIFDKTSWILVREEYSDMITCVTWSMSLLAEDDDNKSNTTAP